MARYKIEYSAGAQVKNYCYGCEVRTKYGDCHGFCPAYRKYKEEVIRSNTKRKTDKYRDSLWYNEMRYNEQPKATTIELLRKKRY